MQPQHNKIDAVEGFPQPRTVKQMQSFLGLAGYYRCHIPKFAKLARPLTELTKINIHSFGKINVKNHFKNLKQN